MFWNSSPLFMIIYLGVDKWDLEILLGLNEIINSPFPSQITLLLCALSVEREKFEIAY